MDISELIANIPHIGSEFMTSYCIINGMPMRLDKLQNMSYEEFWERSKLYMPKKLYKYYPILQDKKEFEEVLLNLFPVVYCKIRPDMTKRLVDYKDKKPTEANLWDIYLHGA